jgi:hypothetical protein
MIKIILKRTWRDLIDMLADKSEMIDRANTNFQEAIKLSQINAERAERVMNAYDVLLAADKEDPVRLAQVIAQWDSKQQAAFFNELAAAPRKQGWTYSFSDALVPDGEGQWYHVAKDLNEEGDKMMTDFAYFVEHRNE